MIEVKQKKFVLGELFCGPGGMAIAADNVSVFDTKGIKYFVSHKWGLDFSKAACATFEKNLKKHSPDVEAICQDVNDFINSGLTEERRITALAFGFPCNSFSSAGEREGLNSKRFGHLYKAGIAVMEAYNPEWFIAENVSGISSHESGKVFKKILQDLADAGKGYNVVAHLYKFEEYGVPQARHRYVIVGIRCDIAKTQQLVFKVPASTHGPDKKSFVTAAEALASVHNTTSWGSSFTRQAERVCWRLKFTAPGENAWTLDELIDESKYPNEKLEQYLKRLPWYDEDIAPLGSIDAIRQKIAWARLKNCNKARMSQIYRRLEPGKPAYTITGSGGGGTHVYHWAEHRALTNEERAALQTFPKDFEFCGQKEEIRKQIGMAVPTDGAKVIFEAILNTFAHKKYSAVEPNPDFCFSPQKRSAEEQ